MLKKVFARTLTLVALIVVSGGFVLAQDWQRFTSTDGRFSVLLPERPEQDNKKRADSQWGPVATQTIHVTTFDSIYTVTYVEFPPSVRLDFERDGEKNLRDYLENIPAKLLTKAKTTLQGYPGFAFTAESAEVTSEGKLLFTHKGRMYVVGNRAYVLEAITPRAFEEGFDEVTKDVDRFLSSFRLTGND